MKRSHYLILGFFALALGGLSGCNEQENSLQETPSDKSADAALCEDAFCAVGEICNTDLNRCEPVTDPLYDPPLVAPRADAKCEDAFCSEGQACNPVTNRCER